MNRSRGRIQEAENFWKDVESRLRNRRVSNYKAAIAAYQSRFRRGPAGDEAGVPELSEVVYNQGVERITEIIEKLAPDLLAARPP